MKNKIKIFIVLFLLSIVQVYAQNSSDSQLALQYYQNKEYNKAVEYYKKLFNKNKSQVYFRYLLKCYTELKDYKSAEKITKKQIKRQASDLSYYVELGNIYKLQNRTNEAKASYNEAIDKLTGDEYAIKRLANGFLNKREFNLAEEVYLKGRKLNQGMNMFYMELANLYSMQRSYQKMIDAYLDMLRDDETHLQTIQNRMQYYVVDKADEDFRELLRISLVKRIQSLANKTIYNELLIWLYVQEKEFDKALFQVKALDKRNKEDGERLISLGKLARSNHIYDVAIKAYRYVINKGWASFYYPEAKSGLMEVLYTKVISGLVKTQTEIIEIEKDYINTIKDLKNNEQKIHLIKDLAHLQAFYLNKADDAIKSLENAINAGGISTNLSDKCKIELADIYIISDDIWGAYMLYAKVEIKNSQNVIGHEAKFKKAKIDYYKGHFQSAQAQLDVLKASTSKLIANDAFELSLLISDNTVLDTTETALQMFANAELLFLRNMDDLALLTLDSIITNFPHHSLSDEIFLKKGEIMLKRNNYDSAFVYFNKIVDQYAFDILADNALFYIADTYHIILKDKENAMKYYKRILTEYPGSIYVAEARKRFRSLRGDKLTEEEKFKDDIDN